MSEEQQFASFREFYPFYLSDHSNVMCRRLHFAGTLAVVLLLGWIIATGSWFWLWTLPIIAYGCAWVGHFVFEKNRPATFTYPFYSFLGDWVMFKDMLIGRVSLLRGEEQSDAASPPVG